MSRPPGQGPRRNLLAPNSSSSTGSRQGGSAGSRLSNNRDDLATQRYTLTQPEDVISLPGQTRYPDFFPWRKSKEEDALAIENVSRGYQEPPIVASETGSERTAMLPILRQWTSLTALQYFLFKALEVREQDCRISTNSTFKPPPRVTLTDQKRETWLKDLASSTVPLRRLSRTIPHGIRGRVLLEQCCTKMIPISRAVWFIRSVGANELRGLKRRGNNASNLTEGGWIHDWTEEVVEFIEKMVKDFDKLANGGWKPRIEYMTRLLAHLYHEELVDRGQVLRWCLRYFQKCKAEEIPMALVFVRMFWAEIVASRVLAQALAHGLLSQYSTVNQLEGSVFESLLSELVESINQLFERSADSFVIPKHWRTLAPVLNEAIKDTPHTQEKLQMVRIRNESLIVSDAPLVREHRDYKAVIVKQLNSLEPPYDFTQFMRAISPWRLEDEQVLHIIFEWACTSDRPGIEKVYIAVSLCSFLQTNGWNVSGALINFLTQLRSRKYCLLSMHDFVHEMTQEDMISLDDYFRASIASGLLFIERLRPQVESQVKVLQNLHLSDFMPGYKTHRDMLLRGIQSLNLDGEKFANAKEMLLQKCDFLGDNDMSSEDYYDFDEKEVSMLEQLQKSSKVDLARMLVQVDKSLTASQYAILERSLVLLRGYRQLYSVIENTIPKVKSGMLLYLLANSVKDHLLVFTTFGNIPKLIESFMNQYKNIRTDSMKMSKGLYDMIQFTLAKINLAPHLKHDLELLIAPSNSASPFDISKLSPMSEFQAEGLSDIAEWMKTEMDLTTEQLTDNKNMSVVFEASSKRFLEACSNEPVDMCRKLVRTMQYMRDADLRTFTDLLVKWLRDKVEPDLYYDRSSFFKVLLFLVIYECLSFDKIADIFMQLKSVRKPGSTISTRLMIDLVSREHIEDIQLRAGEKLSLDFQRRSFEQGQGKVYLKYIAQQIMESAEGDMVDDWLNGTVSRFLLAQVTQQVGVFIATVVDPILETKQGLRMLKAVLSRLCGVSLAQEQPEDDILEIVDVVNSLNLPLCQVVMRVYLKALQLEPRTKDILDATAASPQVATETGYNENEVVKIVLQCVLRGKTLGYPKRVVGDLMIHLDKNLKGLLLFQVELLFLQSPAFPCVGHATGNAVPSLFEVVDAIADSASENICTNHSDEVVQCLEKLVELCENSNNEDEDVEMTDQATATAQDICDGILMFVKIAIIHCQSFSAEMAPLRDKLVNGLLQLLETSIVDSSTELEGLLVDCLNTFRGEISDGQVSTPSNPAAGTPRLGLSRASPKTVAQQHLTHTSSSPSQQPAANAATATAANTHQSLYLKGLMVYDRATDTYSDVTVRSFDLLEDANPMMGLNDVPLNLAMFDCTMDKSNPA